MINVGNPLKFSFLGKEIVCIRSDLMKELRRSSLLRPDEDIE